MDWKNLRPDITRQRILIEGTTEDIVEPREISDYLLKLAEVTEMEVLQGPHTGDAHELGYSGWVHWRTSGAHFYSYPKTNTESALFTVDAYTCKPFDPIKAAEFTRDYFQAKELLWKEIEV